MLEQALAGIFPCISYIAPPKVRNPVWMMLGTCFILKPPTAAIQRKAPVVLLSAAHTFMPWEFQAEIAGIPPPLRKIRYVSGEVHLFDGMGAALAGQHFPVDVCAVNKEIDAAILTISPANCDGFLDALKKRQIFRQYALESGAADETLTATGFRGDGWLGELNTQDKKVVDQMSPEERNRKMLEIRDPRGKQHAHTIAMKAGAVSSCGAKRVAQVTHSQGYHGMSGAPLLPTSCFANSPDTPRSCRGILSGSRDETCSTMVYTDAEAIQQWCATLFC